MFIAHAVPPCTTCWPDPYNYSLYELRYWSRYGSMATLDGMTAQVLRLRQQFSATRRGARLARRLAILQLDEWGYPYRSDTSDAVESIVAELAANAVTHGRVPGRDFELRLLLMGELLRIEVSDARADRRPRPAEAKYGLRIVAALTKEWGVRDRVVGKTVWAELLLP